MSLARVTLPPYADTYIQNAHQINLRYKEATLWYFLRDAGSAIDLDDRDTQGYTAVMYAVYYDSSNCLQTLLRKGASMELTYPGGETLKERARSLGHTESLEELHQEERRRRKGELYSVKYMMVTDNVFVYT